VAAAALQAIPQPDRGVDGAHTVAMAARAVRPGLAPDGAIVLSIEMEMGACITFSIDPAQAETLQQTLSIAIGRRRAQTLRASAASRGPRKP
jgi:hypothetical protein